MPFFRVLIHGEGINLPSETEVPVVGFYTTRTLHAVSEEAARLQAIQLVQDLWKQGQYAQANLGCAPILTAESTTRVSFFQWLRAANGGHSFHSKEESAA